MSAESKQVLDVQNFLSQCGALSLSLWVLARLFHLSFRKETL